MKKQAATLESLDKKIFMIDEKIDVLDKQIKKDRFDRDKVFADMEQRLVNFKAETRTTIELIQFRFDELMAFLKEHMMLRDEIKEYVDDRIDTKFTKYTSDQLNFLDHVGIRCENNENENLAIRYDMDDVKKRLTFVEKRVGV